MPDDPTFPPAAYLLAHDIVRFISQNMEIECRLHMDNWDRETMQKHVNSRGALIHVQKLLLDEGERLLKTP